MVVELEYGELPKPAGVVIADGLGVAERLQQGVRLQDLPDSLILRPTRHARQVGHHDFGGLRLPGPAFAAHENGLVDGARPHVTICFSRGRIADHETNGNQRKPKYIMRSNRTTTVCRVCCVCRLQYTARYGHDWLVLLLLWRLAHPSYRPTAQTPLGHVKISQATNQWYGAVQTIRPVCAGDTALMFVSVLPLIGPSLSSSTPHARPAHHALQDTAGQTTPTPALLPLGHIHKWMTGASGEASSDG